MNLTFDIDIVKRPGVTILVVVGELDLATTPSLDHHIRQALAASTDKVVIDFHRVTFIDGSGIAVVARYAETSDRVRIGHMSGQVKSMFELARMLDRLPMACCR